MTTATMSGDATTVVRVKRHRLLELALYSSVFTTVTTVVWWFWQGQIDPAQLSAALVANDLGARITQFLAEREMIVALATAEFLLGLAVLLALTPLGWWLESDLLPEPEASPVMLLAQSLRKAHAVQRAAMVPDNSPDPTSQPVTQPGVPIPGASAAPGVPGHPSNPSAQHAGVELPGQPVAAQPGQPQVVLQPAQPGQPQAAAQPGQPQALVQPGQPPAPAQPGQPQTAQQPGQPLPPQSALQALEMTPAEESPLDMLGDMSDLLSVFDDDTGIEQWLLDMSDGLDDVEITTLTTMSRQVLRDLRAPRAGGVRSKAASFVPIAV